MVERVCIGCGDSEETARLERCVACGRDFCPDCACKFGGRRYCSEPCARNFFYGEDDDDEDTPSTD